MRIDRAFVTVAGREVHYRRVGSGPPALFLHSSPTNSGFVEDDMLAQADRYSCFAFDTPGFGLSDPLPGETLTVADLALATVATLDALGLAPLPIYGTHTGAAIALELGYRHPAKVAGLVLDAVPMFTREEVAPFGDNYFAPLVVDVLGGHFSAAWTRFRDQSVWFPWCFRDPANLNEVDLLSPESIHRWTEMFFAAAPHYRAAYPAAVRYCEGATEAAGALTVPAVFMASATDMLRPHLARLPALRDNQEIREFGTDLALKRRIVREAFERFGAAAAAPALSLSIEGGTRIKRQFVDAGGRDQMLRYAGDPDAPATLLIHDAPGSSLMLEPRIAELVPNAFVIAPDLPGSGESAPLAEDADLSAYADALAALCDRLGIDNVAIEAHGFGASLAVEMASSPRVRSIAIDGLLLPDDAGRAALIEHYAPPIAIERDGAHWYRTWLMLRDGLIYWPWYDARKAALRREAVTFDAQALHDRTVETMKQRAGYRRFLQAALSHDAAAALLASRIAVARTQAAYSPLAHAYGQRLDALMSEHVSEGVSA